jgi:hypothetical protein
VSAPGKYCCVSPQCDHPREMVFNGGGGSEEIDWDKVRAYGKGKLSESELNDREMDAASDGLDALDWLELTEEVEMRICWPDRPKWPDSVRRRFFRTIPHLFKPAGSSRNRCYRCGEMNYDDWKGKS